MRPLPCQARERGGEFGKTEVALKFRAPPDLLSRPSLQPYLRDGGVISVPLAVTSPDQVLPVEFTLTARLTSGAVTFDPPALAFGQCFTTQVRVCDWMQCVCVRVPLCVCVFV